MTDNIVSVSWGDHLVFGEGDGRLATPEALARRMSHWRDELGARMLHWRVPKAAIPGRFERAPDYPDTIERRETIDWDYAAVVPELAHQHGLQAYLYVSIFDEGWPLAPPEVRAVSYHNAMHGQHIAWQSDFSRRHPDYALVDRTGEQRQWGVLCLAYPQVQEHFVQRFRRWLKRGNWDVLFVCTRSQSKPAEHGDQFGFNEPIREAYFDRYGVDILEGDFDLQQWRDLRGEYLTGLVTRLREMTANFRVSLMLGLPRGGILGPPLDNRPLAWPAWVRRNLVDGLVIDQNSSRCPSMWHHLWPMHRGDGYLQNYLTGAGMPPLDEQLRVGYNSVFRQTEAVRLYLARQWDQRDSAMEGALLAAPAVSGLVFSSFRYE